MIPAIRRFFGLCEHDWERMPQTVSKTLVPANPRVDTCLGFDVVVVKTFHQRCCLRCAKVEVTCIGHETFPLSTWKGDRSELSI
ncbi:hypothetical protein HOU03_gp247 [Caulobacter phage CcrSC]|uniref:Uncharacterized protein n=1 Tax=Caulobacter phage CcrSC TaxID=2283272 RepID=A0A385EDS4_9CAUD|nr:hypothetical protein HOU03_gp247 [Caulobacter phage CcrSC]AXQ70021.1 hypothetical protein CcrSC_gp439 [Caulobacter phage CcrSC]